MIGTQLLVAPGASISAAHREAPIEHGVDDTERSRVLHVARGVPWPRRYAARTLGRVALDRGLDHEEQLRRDTAVQSQLQAAAGRGGPKAALFRAGDDLGLVDDHVPVADIVAQIVTDAERALRQACSDGRLVDDLKTGRAE